MPPARLVFPMLCSMAWSSAYALLQMSAPCLSSCCRNSRLEAISASLSAKMMALSEKIAGTEVVHLEAGCSLCLLFVPSLRCTYLSDCSIRPQSRFDMPPTKRRSAK
eukprot:scaffold56819_cov36-Phaeocystis_antarctica.AAC.2